MKTGRIIIASLVAGILTALIANIPYLNFLNLLCCGLIWIGAAFAVLYLNYLKGDDRERQVDVKEIEEEIERLKEADASLAPEIESSVLQKMFQFNVTKQEGLLVGGFTGIFSALVSGVFYYVQLQNTGFEQIQDMMVEINLPYDPAAIDEVIQLFGSEARTMLYFTIFYTVFMVILYALIGALSGFLSAELFSRLKIFRASSN